MCARWNVIKTSRPKGAFRSCKSDVHKRGRRVGGGRSAFWIIKPSAQSTRGHTLAKYTHTLALTSSSVFRRGARSEKQFNSKTVSPLHTPLEPKQPHCLVISIVFIYIFISTHLPVSFYLHLSHFPRIIGNVCVCVCVHTPFTLCKSVRSPRKFQFPRDKLHFTANLFPALVRRKPCTRIRTHPSLQYITTDFGDKSYFMWRQRCDWIGDNKK